MMPEARHSLRMTDDEAGRMSAGRLAGKVAIVTGASRGLGQYCAVGYGREGAAVVVAARTEQETDPGLPGTIYSTAAMIEQAGGEAMPVACNVANRDSIAAMVAAVMDRYGRIDVLMNNAGVLPAGDLSTIDPRHWELEFRINVHGPFHCSRAVLPHMTAQGSGSIINITSVGATTASHYGITKRALELFTIGLAAEQAGHGIAVNALKPVTAIETPGMYYGRPDLGHGGYPGPERYVESAVLLALQTPQTCTGQVFDDAEAVERLAGPAAQPRA
jgi:NAD(P)-dependent dehydrogenase (short-subunit alcohol dehydrogenase family)